MAEESGMKAERGFPPRTRIDGGVFKPANSPNVRRHNMPARKKTTTVTEKPAPVSRSEAKGSGTSVSKPQSVVPKAVTHEQIAERAYQIFLKRGFGPGDAASDWLEAERQLKAGI